MYGKSKERAKKVQRKKEQSKKTRKERERKETENKRSDEGIGKRKGKSIKENLPEGQREILRRLHSRQWPAGTFENYPAGEDP